MTEPYGRINMTLVTKRQIGYIQLSFRLHFKAYMGIWENCGEQVVN